jgi:antitoxin MazE
MVTKVRKWGNSLALRIPASFASEARVRAGTPVDISVRDGALFIRRVNPRKYRLAALLRKVTKANLHAEISSGPAIGREVW